MSSVMNERSIPSLFHAVVGYPIAEILHRKHVIILIDSIDEGVPHSDSDSRPRTELSWENDILRLLCSHLMQLPGQNVSLVVTGLPDSGQDTYISQMIQSAVQRHRISMTCLGIRDFQPPDQMAFLQSALSPTQAQLPSILPEDALQALFAAGRGSLLHLRLVAAACQVSKEAPSVDSLPQTLPEAYQYYLQALPAPSCGWPAAVEVLEVLVAAREPPSLAMLEQCGLQHAAEVVRALGLLLRITDVGQVYALHGTTLDFFTDREAAGTLYADPARGHQRLCKALLVELDRGAGDASLYCLGNLVKHAHLGGDEAAVDRVVGDIDFLQRCFEVGVGEAVFRDIVQMRGRESGVVYDAVMFLRHNLADLVREPQRAVELAGSTPSGSHFARALREHERKPPAQPLMGLHQSWSTLDFDGKCSFEGLGCMAYSSGGKMLFVGGSSGMLEMLNMDNNSGHQVMKQNLANISCLAYSGDGKVFASASRHGRICISEGASGVLLAEFDTHSNGINCMDFHSDGNTLVCVSTDGAIHILDASRIISRSRPTAGGKGAQLASIYGFDYSRLTQTFHGGQSRSEVASLAHTLHGPLALAVGKWLPETDTAIMSTKSLNVLHIRGSAGSGKSEAMASVLKHLMDSSDSSSGVNTRAVLSLFLRRDNANSQDPSQAVKELARQLWEAFPEHMAQYVPQTAAATSTENLPSKQKNGILKQGAKVILTRDYAKHGDATDGPLRPGQVTAQYPTRLGNDCAPVFWHSEHYFCPHAIDSCTCICIT